MDWLPEHWWSYDGLYFMAKIVVVLLVLFWFVRWFREENERLKETLDSLVNEAVAKTLAKHLSLSQESLLGLFSGQKGLADKELIGQLEEKVRDVTLHFVRKDSSLYELVVRVVFSGQEDVKLQTSLRWEELPDELRGQFLREGCESITVPWVFPWQQMS